MPRASPINVINTDVLSHRALKKKTVTVNDKMQRGYRYVLSAPIGRNFDPDFRPELTPARNAAARRVRRQIHDRLHARNFRRAGLRAQSSPKSGATAR